MYSIDHILQSVFHHEQFRPHQREIVQDVVSGHDVVCVMPTGAGKSLCFQLPAVALRGLTIIVSPLISLMADQVQHLRKLRIPAMYLNGSQPWDIQRKVLTKVEEGFRGLLYIAPERFWVQSFQRLLPQLKPSLFVVDEAHCVSFWGHDFRPEYMRLAEVREQLGSPVTVAVTATATPQVQKDMVTMLGLKSPKVHVTGFDRPNLAYTCRSLESYGEKDAALLRFVKARKGGGIVYCSTRKAVEDLSALLEEHFPDRIVCGYHAGMTQASRAASQKMFMAEDDSVVIATNAFGMGINKPDIRFVVHYNLPGSVEAYYQEAGRAGRDGKPSNCLLFYNSRDLRTQEFFIKNIGENNTALGKKEIESLQKHARKKLDLMLSYASSMRCRRRQILDYFGESTAVVGCECDVCQTLAHHRYKPDGVRHEFPRRDRAENPVWGRGSAPSESSRQQSAVPKRGTASTPVKPLDSTAEERYARLKRVRLGLAHELECPAFHILHDRVMREIAREAPASIDELMMVKGIGPVKAEKFGAAFLAALSES
jgi:ATP-dependent DNA helicase RecQ